MVRLEGDGDDGEGDSVDLEFGRMDSHRDEVTRESPGGEWVDVAREHLVASDVYRRTCGDPVRDGRNSVRESVRETKRADEDHAGEGNRHRGRPRASRDARRGAQDRARHASSDRRMPRAGINVRRVTAGPVSFGYNSGDDRSNFPYDPTRDCLGPGGTDAFPTIPLGIRSGRPRSARTASS